MGGNTEIEQRELGSEAHDLAEYVGISETPLEDGEVRFGESLPDLGDRVRVSIHRENPQAGREKNCRVSPTTRGAIDSPAPPRGEARYLIGQHGSMVGHRRHGQKKKKPRLGIKRGAKTAVFDGADETRTRDLRCDRPAL